MVEVMSEQKATTTDTNAQKMPNKETELEGVEDEFGRMTVQNVAVQSVARLALAAHSNNQQSPSQQEQQGASDQEDTHTELLPPISRRTSLMRNNGGVGVRRAQSLRISRPIGGPAAGLSSSLVGTSGADAAPRQALRRSYSSQNSHRRPPTATPSGGLSRNRSFRSSRAAPGRSISTDGSLRGFRRDQLVNVSIRSKDSAMFDRKDRSVVRSRSGDDLSSVCSGLDSCFTTDSINLRKSQLIADPLDGNYNEIDSCADHDTICDTFSQYTTDFDGYTEYPPDGRYIRSDASIGENSFCSNIESFQIRGMQVTQALDEVSFFSNSGSYSDFDLEETITEAFEETGTEVESETVYSETVE